ncbi:hypothetical protein [Methylobacterium sp. 37f]|uniref:hypothetical protein n=1 Tax=Methylobacterium sp. 37f TaxID=2817058 RepID=UPI001FFC462C|nr:hypothetical protein [Methylobacterium sp. 37f]MCK2054773.1 hypothetical protein [Methylobacterium sp. 37f]
MTTAVVDTKTVDLKSSLMEALGQQKGSTQFNVGASIVAINTVAAAHSLANIDMAGHRVSLMYRAILEIQRDKKNLAAFDKERVRHQVTPARAGANEYYPFVRVMDGHWADLAEKTVTFENIPNLRKWYPNPSSLKYAVVIAELIALGISPEDSEKFIQDYKFSKTGQTRLRGLEAANKDRRNPPKRKRGDKWPAADKEAAYKAHGLCELDPEVAKSLTFESDFALAIVRFVNGRMEIICDAGLDGNAVIKAVKAQQNVWASNPAPTP